MQKFKSVTKKVMVSSVSSDELSLTLTSLTKAVLAVLVASGVYVSTNGASTVLEQIPVIVSAGYATFQAIQTVWGAIRKIYIAIKNWSQS